MAKVKDLFIGRCGAIPVMKAKIGSSKGFPALSAAKSGGDEREARHPQTPVAMEYGFIFSHIWMMPRTMGIGAIRRGKTQQLGDDDLF